MICIYTVHRAADETLTIPFASAKLQPRAGQRESPSPRSYQPLLILLLITVVGGFFRFYRLTFPALWNDETLVYWRVCGTYAQMLKPLRNDMFPPLHYSLYWLIGHYHKLTPVTMRMVPAVAGTLTIPAIYFLSRQLFSKGTSLVAAAFTACSSFMLFYSRDAKMYPHLWLFVTLNAACLLWWFRTNKSTAWLCWIAAGCAACGLHFSAFAMVAISLLFLLTQKSLHWKKVVWFLVGTALIAAGPVGYFTKFNPVAERLDTNGWSATGIGWVGGFFNGDRTGPQHAQYAAASFLAGYEWPRDDYIGDDSDPPEQPIDPSLLEVPQTAVSEIFGILAIAALPWPLFLRPRRDPAAEPQWRVVLWLGGWIFLVGYGFYCHSVKGFVSPQRWNYELMEWLPVWAIPVTLGVTATFIAITATHRKYRPNLIRFFQFLFALAALYGGCFAIYQFAFSASMKADLNGTPWGSIWEPRYLGFIWPAFGIATAALLMRLPTRPVRITCIFFVLAVNLGMADMRMEISTEPPIDLLARDLWASQDPQSTIRTFYLIRKGDIAVAGSSMSQNTHVASGRYYLEMESNRQPMSPERFAASLDEYTLRQNPSYNVVKRSVESSPKLQHVIIWTQLLPRQPLTFDPYRRVLTGWKLADEQVYTVRIYWDWRERWTWVRRDYVRGKK